MKNQKQMLMLTTKVTIRKESISHYYLERGTYNDISKSLVICFNNGNEPLVISTGDFVGAKIELDCQFNHDKQKDNDTN